MNVVVDNKLPLCRLTGVAQQNDDDGRMTHSSYQNTRRSILATSAGAFGGVALGSAFGTPVLADEDDDEGHDEMPEDEMPEDEFEDDVDILNYALTLEFLESSFYEEGLDNISEDDLLQSDPLQEFGDPIRDRVYEELQTIKEHEQIHAETLGSVIEDLGGEPVEEPEFDFGTAVEEPAEFIATGVTLEDTGVSAYAGAAPFIEDEELVTSALSIHSVEARHASFLRTLNDQTGFPAPFDEARSRSEVLDAAGGFIVDDKDEHKADTDDDDNDDDDQDEAGY